MENGVLRDRVSKCFASWQVEAAVMCCYRCQQMCLCSSHVSHRVVRRRRQAESIRALHRHRPILAHRDHNTPTTTDLTYLVQPADSGLPHASIVARAGTSFDTSSSTFLSEETKLGSPREQAEAWGWLVLCLAPCGCSQWRDIGMQ